jgi:predicted amidohydrolase
LARRKQTYRVHLAQIAPALGDVALNRDRHLERIEAARADNADLVVFPELSLTGYWLHDLAGEIALDPATAEVLEPLRQASREIDVVLGLVEAGRDGEVYNSAVWLAGGEVAACHRKVHLPTYALFDEARYFAAGRTVRAFDSVFGRTGLLVCEDLWHPALPYLLAQDGSDLLVILSSAPGRGIEAGPLGSERAWQLLGETTARFHTQFVVYVNRVGSEDGCSFTGGSFAYAPDGTLLARLGDLEEGGETVEMDRREIPRVRRISPMRRGERPELVHRELARILTGRTAGPAADGDGESGGANAGENGRGEGGRGEE